MREIRGQPARRDEEKCAPDRRELGEEDCDAAALAAVLFAALPLAQVRRDRTALTVHERMSTTGSGGLRAMNGLVVVQVALSLGLLAPCGSARPQRAADRRRPSAGQGLTAWVTVPGLATEERAALFGALVDRLRNEPLVEAASASGGGMVVSFLSAGDVYVRDSPVAGPASAVTTRYRPVSGGYFETLGIPLLAGRDFEAAEESGAAVAIVNRTLAERYWPGTNPIGRSLQRPGRTRPGAGSGLSATPPGAAFNHRRMRWIYVPHAQDPPSWTWVNLQTRANPRAGLSVLRKHLRVLDAGGAVSAPRTFAEHGTGRRDRASAETTPTVTVWLRPKGAPMAITQSPGAIRLESPNLAAGSFRAGRSTSSSSALSVSRSRPSTRAA